MLVEYSLTILLTLMHSGWNSSFHLRSVQTAFECLTVSLKQRLLNNNSKNKYINAVPRSAASNIVPVGSELLKKHTLPNDLIHKTAGLSSLWGDLDGKQSTHKQEINWDWVYCLEAWRMQYVCHKAQPLLDTEPLRHTLKATCLQSRNRRLPESTWGTREIAKLF